MDCVVYEYGAHINMSEEAPNFDYNAAIEALKGGDMEDLDGIVDDLLEKDADSFVEVSKIIASVITAANWEKYRQNLKLYITAIFENNKAIQEFAKILTKSEMFDFAKFFFDTIANFIDSKPEQTYKIALFISSHVAQTNSSFYKYAIEALYSNVIAKSESPEFESVIEAFNNFTNFEEDGTSEIMQELMNNVFRSIAARLRESSDKFATLSFVNLLRFWASYAFKYENYTDAFVTILVHSLRCDSSLKLNPFRLHVIDILIKYGEYIAPISPLMKVLLKSISKKQNSEAEFDFDTLMISTKEIGRTEKYQESILAKAIKQLRQCLYGIRNSIAFPEIAAPVVRALTNMIEDENFAAKKEELESLLEEVKENTTFVEKYRMKAGLQADFKIDQNVTIEGEAPFTLE